MTVIVATVLVKVIVIVIGCIIYFLGGDYFRRNVAVTVVKSLPLPILKKWLKEDKNKKENIVVEKVDIKSTYDNNIIDTTSKISGEVSISTVQEENKNIQFESESNNTEDIGTTEEVILDEVGSDILEEEILVYWTPNGKSYHGKSTCRTLVRSKIINCGTISESGKDFKCEHCK